MPDSNRVTPLHFENVACTLVRQLQIRLPIVWPSSEDLGNPFGATHQESERAPEEQSAAKQTSLQPNPQQVEGTIGSSKSDMSGVNQFGLLSVAPQPPQYETMRVEIPSGVLSGQTFEVMCAQLGCEP